MKAFLSMFPRPWLALSSVLLNFSILVAIAAQLIGSVSEPQVLSPELVAQSGDCAFGLAKAEVIRAANDWWYWGKGIAFSILWLSIASLLASVIMFAASWREFGVKELVDSRRSSG